ncbi:MAG: NACHT domain-containing protein [Nostoc sp. TH1S01]|nr:NACHT domain-containing protein [Nostoc sp. TH1S01]
MTKDKSLSIEQILEILEAQVLERTGRYLSKAEKAVIKGTWENKEYSQIASDSGYSLQYLQTGVGPQLWATLTDVIGDGVQVKKTYLKNVLIKFAKKHYMKLEISKLDSNSLVGKTKVYGRLPRIPYFYGRDEEIGDLKKQIKISQESCIAITGVGGIGKTLLTAKLIEETLFENPNMYDYIIWNRINRFSSIDDLLSEILTFFNITVNDESLSTKVSLLLKQFHLYKCLLIIDGFEKLVQVDNYQKKLEYEDFFVGLTKEVHQSCIILTSQIPLEEITHLTTSFYFSSLHLEGLKESAAMQMIHEKGLGGEKCRQLIEIYRGNPSELEAVINKIHRFFGGSVERFFEYSTTMMGPQIQAMLHIQFGQPGFLSNLQKQIMVYLAHQMSQDCNDIPFSKIVDDLKERLDIEVSISELITAIDTLEHRSLIESNKQSNQKEISYRLQPVVKKYILVDPLGLVNKEQYLINKEQSKMATSHFV